MARSWKVKMGHIVTVPNAARKFGAARKYGLIKLQAEDGKEGYFLFTANALRVARERAQKNPEDILKSARLIDALD